MDIGTSLLFKLEGLEWLKDEWITRKQPKYGQQIDKHDKHGTKHIEYSAYKVTKWISTGLKNQKHIKLVHYITKQKLERGGVTRSSLEPYSSSAASSSACSSPASPSGGSSST